MAITLRMSSCGSPGGQNWQESTDTLEHQASEASQGQLTPLDIPAIEKALGMKGEEKNGEYKVSVPQNDLKIMVDGFQIIPPMGLGSWAALAPADNGAMLMGDVVVTEDDLRPVQQEVIAQGLTITAIHNHFIRNRSEERRVGKECFSRWKIRG